MPAIHPLSKDVNPGIVRLYGSFEGDGAADPVSQRGEDLSFTWVSTGLYECTIGAAASGGVDILYVNASVQENGLLASAHVIQPAAIDGTGGTRTVRFKVSDVDAGPTALADLATGDFAFVEIVLVGVADDELLSS